MTAATIAGAVIALAVLIPSVLLCGLFATAYRRAASARHKQTRARLLRVLAAQRIVGSAAAGAGSASSAIMDAVSLLADDVASKAIAAENKGSNGHDGDSDGPVAAAGVQRAAVAASVASDLLSLTSSASASPALDAKSAAATSLATSLGPQAFTAAVVASVDAAAAALADVETMIAVTREHRDADAATSDTGGGDRCVDSRSDVARPRSVLYRAVVDRAVEALCSMHIAEDSAAAASGAPRTTSSGAACRAIATGPASASASASASATASVPPRTLSTAALSAAADDADAFLQQYYADACVGDELAGAIAHVPLPALFELHGGIAGDHCDENTPTSTQRRIGSNSRSGRSLSSPVRSVRALAQLLSAMQDAPAGVDSANMQSRNAPGAAAGEVTELEVLATDGMLGEAEEASEGSPPSKAVGHGRGHAAPAAARIGPARAHGASGSVEAVHLQSAARRRRVTSESAKATPAAPATAIVTPAAARRALEALVVLALDGAAKRASAMVVASLEDDDEPLVLVLESLVAATATTQPGHSTAPGLSPGLSPGDVVIGGAGYSGNDTVASAATHSPLQHAQEAAAASAARTAASAASGAHSSPHGSILMSTRPVPAAALEKLLQSLLHVAKATRQWTRRDAHRKAWAAARAKVLSSLLPCARGSTLQRQSARAGDRALSPEIELSQTPSASRLGRSPSQAAPPLRVQGISSSREGKYSPKPSATSHVGLGAAGKGKLGAGESVPARPLVAPGRSADQPHRFDLDQIDTDTAFDVNRGDFDFVATSPLLQLMAARRRAAFSASAVSQRSGFALAESSAGSNVAGSKSDMRHEFIAGQQKQPNLPPALVALLEAAAEGARRSAAERARHGVKLPPLPGPPVGSASPALHEMRLRSGISSRSVSHGAAALASSSSRRNNLGAAQRGKAPMRLSSTDNNHQADLSPAPRAAAAALRVASRSYASPRNEPAPVRRKRASGVTAVPE